MRGVVYSVFILLHINAFTQLASNPRPTFKKNSFYLSGDLTSALLAATLNYERNLLSPDLKLMRFLNARLSYGRWIAASAGGSNYTFTLHSISGLNKHHVEATLGLSVYFNNKDYEFELKHNSNASRKEYFLHLPQIGLGYRFQKPGGILVFRACVGVPFLQCSLGLAF